MQNQFTFTRTRAVALILLASTGCDQKTEDECIAEMEAELNAVSKMQEERMFSKNEADKINREEWLRSNLAISEAILTVSGLAIDEHRDACDYYVYGTSVRRK